MVCGPIRGEKNFSTRKKSLFNYMEGVNNIFFEVTHHQNFLYKTDYDESRHCTRFLLMHV